MKLLFDTHLLLWAATADARLPMAARQMLDDPDTEPLFSAASLWEVAIKAGLGRDDFSVDPRRLFAGLVANGYVELPITTAHALVAGDLPLLHRDPFDRMLIAQGLVEGAPLVTVDRLVAAYGASVRLV